MLIIGEILVQIEELKMGKRYRTVDALIKDLKKSNTWWDKFILNPKMNWLRWIIYNLPDIPKNCYRNIKWFIQRGKKGYADCDVWDFDNYLSKIISNGLIDLKSQVHGVPCHPNFSSKDGKDIYLDKWKTVLDEIIWTFEVVQKIINAEWLYLNSKKRNNTKMKEFGYYIMSKEECLRYRSGWKLFQKYYFNLWD